jgi:hypothetical protein
MELESSSSYPQVLTTCAYPESHVKHTHINTVFKNLFLITGYVYMNGDIGKLPSGAVYPTVPDPLVTTASTSTDYR